MNTTSYYCVECKCGHKVQTPAKISLCTKCGEEIKLNWPGDMKPLVEPKTVSAKYEKDGVV